MRIEAKIMADDGTVIETVISEKGESLRRMFAKPITIDGIELHGVEINPLCHWKPTAGNADVQKAARKGFEG